MQSCVCSQHCELQAHTTLYTTPTHSPPTHTRYKQATNCLPKNRHLRHVHLGGPPDHHHQQQYRPPFALTACHVYVAHIQALKNSLKEAEAHRGQTEGDMLYAELPHIHALHSQAKGNSHLAAPISNSLLQCHICPRFHTKLTVPCAT